MHTRRTTQHRKWLGSLAVAAALALLVLPTLILSQPAPNAGKKKDVGKSSYDQIAPVILGQETFAEVMARDKAGKAAVMARQQKLLELRYDLTRKDHDSCKMSRGKPIPVGPTTRLAEGVTFEALAAMAPDEIRDKGTFPIG